MHMIQALERRRKYGTPNLIGFRKSEAGSRIICTHKGGAPGEREKDATVDESVLGGMKIVSRREDVPDTGKLFFKFDQDRIDRIPMEVKNPLQWRNRSP